MSRDNEVVVYTFGTHTGASPDLAGLTLVDLCELLPDLVDPAPDWPHPDDAQETALQLQFDPRLDELSQNLVKQATSKRYREAIDRGRLEDQPGFAVCCRDGRRLSPYLAQLLRRDLWLYGCGLDAKVVNLQLKADDRAVRDLATRLDQLGTSVFEVSTAGPAERGPDRQIVLGLEELAGLLGRAADAGRTVSWRLANFPTWIDMDMGTPRAMSVRCPHCSYRASRSFDGSVPSVAAALVDLTVRAEHRHLDPAPALR